MPFIHLTTFIAAPAERVFDLSRSVELHKESMRSHKEEAVSGIRFGLMEKEESVTWKAKHLFKTRLLRVKITEWAKPFHFVDEQAQGDFRAMRHEHYFKPCDNGTIMIDKFYYEIPYGKAGTILNKLFLTGYLKNLLVKRNLLIKEYAESAKWQRILKAS